jgi:hypothetical protein
MRSSLRWRPAVVPTPIPVGPQGLAFGYRFHPFQYVIFSTGGRRAGAKSVPSVWAMGGRPAWVNSGECPGSRRIDARTPGAACVRAPETTGPHELETPDRRQDGTPERGGVDRLGVVETAGNARDQPHRRPLEVLGEEHRGVDDTVRLRIPRTPLLGQLEVIVTGGPVELGDRMLDPGVVDEQPPPALGIAPRGGLDGRRVGTRATRRDRPVVRSRGACGLLVVDSNRSVSALSNVVMRPRDRPSWRPCDQMLRASGDLTRAWRPAASGCQVRCRTLVVTTPEPAANDSSTLGVRRS